MVRPVAGPQLDRLPQLRLRFRQAPQLLQGEGLLAPGVRAGGIEGDGAVEGRQGRLGLARPGTQDAEAHVHGREQLVEAQRPLAGLSGQLDPRRVLVSW